MPFILCNRVSCRLLQKHACDNTQATALKYLQLTLEIN